MSRPKLLKIFDSSTEDVSYSKFNNPVTVSKSGSTLIIDNSVEILNNTTITFKSPCNCSEITTITSGTAVFQFVDAADHNISTGRSFKSGSMLSVLLEVATEKAYLLNQAPTEPLIMSSIAITKAPDRIYYRAKECFDNRGMIVKVTCLDGTVYETSDYTVSPSGSLSVSDTYVTISVTEGGVTKTARQEVHTESNVLAIPYISSNVIIYNGDVQDPLILNYDETLMNISGTTQSTDAGTYNLSVSLKDALNFSWTDGTTEAKNLSWTISKRAGSISFDKSSINLTGASSATVSISKNSTGAISVSNNNTSNLQTTLSGATITATSLSNYYTGSATITVSVAADSNTLASSKTIPVSISGIYKVYGIRIDESNSNPLTALSYIEGTDSYGMTKGSDAWDTMPLFEGIRPCILKDGEVTTYLDKNNFGKTVDGRDVAIDSTCDGDVMIEFPKGGYKFIRNGTNLDIYITNNPNAYSEGYAYHSFSYVAEGDCNHFWIGAYLTGSTKSSSTGYTISFKSASSVPTSSVPSSDSELSYLNYYQVLWLQLLYVLKYGNLNSQEVLGDGVTENTTLSSTITGLTYLSGMTLLNRGSGEITKLFGLELPYCGSYGTILAGIDILVPSNNSPRTISTGYPGESSLSKSIANSSYGGYIKRASGSNIVGFYPDNTTGGSSSTYYSDYLYMSISSSSGVIWRERLYWGSYDHSPGLFSISMFETTSIYYGVVSRVSYCRPNK